MLVDGAIEVFPVAFDFDVGFIKTPAQAVPLFVFTKYFLDARRIMYDPALNAAVGTDKLKRCI